MLAEKQGCLIFHMEFMFLDYTNLITGIQNKMNEYEVLQKLSSRATRYQTRSGDWTTGRRAGLTVVIMGGKFRLDHEK